MKILYRLYEFFFDRWKWEVLQTKQIDVYLDDDKYPYKAKQRTTYRLTNKFDGSTKIIVKEI